MHACMALWPVFLSVCQCGGVLCIEMVEPIIK